VIQHIGKKWGAAGPPKMDEKQLSPNFPHSSFQLRFANTHAHVGNATKSLRHFATLMRIMPQIDVDVSHQHVKHRGTSQKVFFQRAR
jgi:hypothetical protein